MELDCKDLRCPMPVVKLGLRATPNSTRRRRGYIMKTKHVAQPAELMAAGSAFTLELPEWKPDSAPLQTPVD